MALKAAIFDCDGTILDSMPMWEACCVNLLESYGVQDAREVFLAHESLDMDKKCFYYHDALGIGESGEALYRELWRAVEVAYAREVTPFPGAREFISDLRERGIPCVIASSTPPELLRSALAAHDLLHLFSEVIFCGEVGRGKEYPDVYVAAAERLGFAREDTWVFEDAPFGMRSATRAGLPVCGLVNDHDGRDEAFCARWSRVLVHDYAELSFERLDALAAKVLRALVVAGSPEPSSPALVARLASSSDLIVVADRGADVAREAGITPHVFCGDEDSISDAALAWVKETVSERFEFRPEKYDTDLGLALELVRERADAAGASVALTVTCASGGRPDHALAVWGVLARSADLRPRMVEDGFECRILSRWAEPSWAFEGEVGTSVSAIALAPGTCVSERGMRWDLDHKELELLGDLGVSNRVVAQDAEIICHAGVLAVFRHLG